MSKGVFAWVLVAGVAATVLATTGCTRIETGEVGIRQRLDKTIDPTELQPGSWNQTLIGNVLTFPVKDIVVTLENKTPLTSDSTALADFDVTVVYGINPTAVAELYTTKSRAFHATDAKNDDILLMAKYVETLINNASYKVVREYRALEVADHRAKIEEKIRLIVQEQLQQEKLDAQLQLTVVQVRNALPNPEILHSATQYVKAQNELRIKETEVAIARKESERMAALAQNSAQSIEYMNAQARLKIAEGVQSGKVHAIVVPYDFKGFVNVGGAAPR